MVEADDRLHIRGLRAYGHTGFFAEEQRLGQWFAVDLCLWLPLAAAGRSDDLRQSLDYGAVVQAVQELVEQARHRTIERLAAAICERVLAWEQVREIETTLTKLHPPIPGFSGEVAVTLRRGREASPQPGEEAWVTAAIGLGSNLGDSRAQLAGALGILAATEGVRLVGVSPWYRTPAVGPPQPDYLNGCALLQTLLPAPVLLELLLAIEIRFGRFRGERWGARSLDLDLLFYGDRIFHTPTLQVPHPRLAQRGFVLVPLAEIAPEWRHPASGHTVAELLEAWQRQQPACSMGSSSIVESPPHAQPLLRRSAPPGD